MSWYSHIFTTFLSFFLLFSSNSIRTWEPWRSISHIHSFFSPHRLASGVEKHCLWAKQKVQYVTYMRRLEVSPRIQMKFVKVVPQASLRHRIYLRLVASAINMQNDTFLEKNCNFVDIRWYRVSISYLYKFNTICVEFIEVSHGHCVR